VAVFEKGQIPMDIPRVALFRRSESPQLCEGRECFVSYPAEERINHPHQVTLFTSGGSETSAHLIPVVGQVLPLQRLAADGQSIYTPARLNLSGKQCDMQYRGLG
jgi:hypothetical protein